MSGQKLDDPGGRQRKSIFASAEGDFCYVHYEYYSVSNYRYELE
jgi:hypothetical protein